MTAQQEAKARVLDLLENLEMECRFSGERDLAELALAERLELRGELLAELSQERS